MTYKAVLQEVIRKDAQNWIEYLLKQSGIAYRYTYAYDPATEHSKALDGFYWIVRVLIILPDYKSREVRAYGFADSVIGIERREVLDNDQITLWRADQDISEFKIPNRDADMVQ